MKLTPGSVPDAGLCDAEQEILGPLSLCVWNYSNRRREKIYAHYLETVWWACRKVIVCVGDKRLRAMSTWLHAFTCTSWETTHASMCFCLYIGFESSQASYDRGWKFKHPSVARQIMYVLLEVSQPQPTPRLLAGPDQFLRCKFSFAAWKLRISWQNWLFNQLLVNHQKNWKEEVNFSW